jgi:hypothetical protein
LTNNSYKQKLLLAIGPGNKITTFLDFVANNQHNENACLEIHQKFEFEVKQQNFFVIS